MEAQARKLKITARNIRSNLLSSNKQLSNIRSTEDQIDSNNEKRRLKRVKERRLETSRTSKKNKGRGLGKAVKGEIFSEESDMLDNILSFVGIILVGKAVVELPKAIGGQGPLAGIMKTLEPVMESLKGGLNAIGNGMQGITKSVEKEKVNETQSTEKKKETLDVSVLEKDLNLGEAEELIKTIAKDATNLETVVGDHGISDERIDEFIKKNQSAVSPKEENKKEKPKPKITANNGKINPIEVLEKNKHLIPSMPFMDTYQMVLEEIKKDPTKYDTKEEIENALKRYNIDPSKIKYNTSGLTSTSFDVSSIKPIEKKYNIDGQTVSGGAVKTIIVTQRVIVPT